MGPENVKKTGVKRAEVPHHLQVWECPPQAVSIRIEPIKIVNNKVVDTSKHYSMHDDTMNNIAILCCRFAKVAINIHSAIYIV